MQFTTRHEFRCAPETFFSEQVYFHPDFHEGLYRELRFRSWEVESRTEPDGTIIEHRTKRPERDLPMVLRKALGVDHIEYSEDAIYQPATLRYEFKVRPNVMASKIRIQGCYHIEAAVPGRCVRIVEMEVEVKIPIFGRRVERYLAKELMQSYDVAADFTRRWISERLDEGPAT